jgi:hypothetical protein
MLSGPWHDECSLTANMNQDRIRKPNSIRAAVEAVDREMSLLVELERASVTDGLAVSGLHASWDSLVDLMALGPEPELLQCPNCGRPGESGAGHCWTCWEALVPSPASGRMQGRRVPDAA